MIVYIIYLHVYIQYLRWRRYLTSFRFFMPFTSKEFHDSVNSTNSTNIDTITTTFIHSPFGVRMNVTVIRAAALRLTLVGNGKFNRYLITLRWAVTTVIQYNTVLSIHSATRGYLIFTFYSVQRLPTDYELNPTESTPTLVILHRSSIQ